MKRILLIAILFFASNADAHDLKAKENPNGGEPQHQDAHEHDARHSKQPSNLKVVNPLPHVVSAASIAGQAALQANSKDADDAPVQSKAFQVFPKLEIKWDEDFLYVGSNGLPDHNMMVGITNWQQQVPLPHLYIDDNAWRIPLKPVPATTPATIDGNFLRGAIALAANGVPIFNPQNNRGEVAQEIGELDKWGGHCGRADDYHYHIVPLHLQAQVGKEMPLAYALDGYPIYGLTEPDGSPVGKLDECHGHEDAKLGYHYHASTEYPYVIGGFHGEVKEMGGQVSPQPRANGVRPNTPPLRGVEITGFESTGEDSYKLNYKVNGEQRSIAYSFHADGTYPFEFDNGSEGKTKEVYTARQGGGGGGPPGGAKGNGQGEGKGDKGGKGKGKGGKGNGNGGPGPEMRTEDQPAARLDSEGRPQRPQDKNAGDRGGKEEAFVALPDQPRSSDGKFRLKSSVFEDLKALPSEFTGDGNGISPPLEWTGAPESTKGYALIMDHVAPGGGKKWYWTVHDIPSNIMKLPQDSQTIGTMGTGFKNRTGYEPPNSKGAGAKTYVFTIYALSGPIKPKGNPGREELLAAMKGKVLASSSLRVVHTSQGATGGGGGNRPRPQNAMRDQPPSRPDVPSPKGTQNTERPPGTGGKGKGKGGKGKGGGPSGLIKPSIDDTMKLNVYADNWFMLYVNGRLVAVDPIQFTPHNVVSVDFLPEYPMTIAVLAKDNAGPTTGMEYGTNIGDGGFILKFADGTVTNATWKAKNFFHGPIKGDTANPKVKQEALPKNWWSVDFDDTSWAKAKEYTVEEVGPKQPYFDSDFEGAHFIWTEDLALDNTVIFRTMIENRGWTQRWNTKPDLDVTEAPLR